MLQKIQHLTADLFGSLPTGIHIKIGMLPRMSEALFLGGNALCPEVLVGATRQRGFVVYVEVDEHVWPGDFLPHIGHIGVFLGGVADVAVAGAVQGVAQGAFARGARADNGDA